MIREFISWIIIFIADLISFFIILIATFFIRKWMGEYGILPPYYMTLKKLFLTWWMPAIYMLSFAFHKLYTFRFPFWEESKRIIKAIFFATITILAIVSLGKLTDKVSRTTVIMMAIFSIFIFPAERKIVKTLLYKIGLWQRKITAIGNKNFIKTISGIFNSEAFMGYVVSHSIEINKEFSIKELKDIPQNVAVISIPKDLEEPETFLAKVQRLTKTFFFVPEIKGLAFLNSELFPLFFSEVFLLHVKNNLKSPLNKFLKSCFDIGISIIIILPLLLPIIGIIAILIKLDSKGPVFFVHRRIGKHGKPIKIIKFRTMYTDAQERLKKLFEENPEAKKEWETYYKLKNDPRVTKVGKFLRKTSLDELPQIVNVIKGDMSLVGPRPVIKEEIDKYYKEFAQYYYMVKPGISGLWQVSGRSDTDYEKRVRLDTWYVLNWSLWLDIVILIKTVKTVLKKEGAY